MTTPITCPDCSHDIDVHMSAGGCNYCECWANPSDITRRFLDAATSRPAAPREDGAWLETDAAVEALRQRAERAAASPDCTCQVGGADAASIDGDWLAKVAREISTGWLTLRQDTLATAAPREALRDAWRRGYGSGHSAGYLDAQGYHAHGDGCGPDSWDCDCPTPEPPADIAQGEDRGVGLLRGAWRSTRTVPDPAVGALLRQSLTAAAAQHPEQAAVLPELEREDAALQSIIDELGGLNLGADVERRTAAAILDAVRHLIDPQGGDRA